MSSCLCEKAEGAIPPVFVKPAKDGKDEAIHAGLIDETDHGSGPAAHLHEAAFDDVGGSQLPPQGLGRRKKLSSSGRSCSSRFTITE